MRGKPLLLSVVDGESSLTGASTRSVARLAYWAVTAFRATAFWTAVLVPLAYPLLLVGSAGGVELDVLVGLVGLHATALVAGHVHDGLVPGRGVVG